MLLNIQVACSAFVALSTSNSVACYGDSDNLTLLAFEHLLPYSIL